jgi:hypothetical protein
MSTQAQGAIGAEAMTAGQAAFEAFWNGQQGLPWDCGSKEAQQPWERAAAAAIKHAATPRTDSDERTTGGVRALIRAAAEAAFEHGWAVGDPASDPTDEAAKVTVALRDALAAVTPAPSSPGVPDSVRALSEAVAERDDAVRTLEAWFDTKAKSTEQAVPKLVGALQGYLRTARCGGMPAEESDMAEAVITSFLQQQAGSILAPIIESMAAERARTLISAHPAGQSTGLGAEGLSSFSTDELLAELEDRARAGDPEAQERPERAEPAPDSTRTGPEGAGEGGLLYRLRAAFDSDRVADKNLALRRAYDALAARPAAPEAQGAETFQARADRWLDAVTDGDPTDLQERRDRYSEESLELVQALGATREGMHELVDYVFSRPVGEPGDEMGDTKLCLANLASWAKLNMDACGEAMLARRSKPESVAKIRRKRSTRHGRGPLPGIDAPAPPASSGQESAR